MVKDSQVPTVAHVGHDEMEGEVERQSTEATAPPIDLRSQSDGDGRVSV